MIYFAEWIESNSNEPRRILKSVDFNFSNGKIRLRFDDSYVLLLFFGIGE